MARRRLFTQSLGPLSHLPTWMLLIGTGVYWLELYFIRLPGGHSSWLAWGLWIILALIAAKQYFPLRSGLKFPFLVYMLGILAIVYLSIIYIAAILPPHLVQEYDAINYHITIPRQHLILHGFAHIPWSVADLFLLPLDYALSPFWLSTPLPNKLPQFIFLLGALGLVFSIVYRYSHKDLRKSAVATIAVMAMHMTAIQSGTAMLDMVMLYCVLAYLHSLMTGRFVLAGIEGAFFFWSKSFIPPMMVALLTGVFLVCFIAKRMKYSFGPVDAMQKAQSQKLWLTFIIVSVIIASPFVIKSVHYTGALLYPFAIHQDWASVHYDPAQWEWIETRTKDNLSKKNAYGHGRGVMAFVKHFWLMAVPEKGVNNAFDYPVGLIYLLVLGPFVLSLVKASKQKEVPVLSIFIIAWWVLWWFGSQQTRFLFIPIVLMIVVVVIYMKELSRIFIALVIAAMLLEIISLVNAHRPDWGKSAFSVLRDQDKELVRLGQQKEQATSVILDYPDVAFASFEVDVRNNTDSIFVFPKVNEIRVRNGDLKS